MINIHTCKVLCVLVLVFAVSLTCKASIPTNADGTYSLYWPFDESRYEDSKSSVSMDKWVLSCWSGEGNHYAADYFGLDYIFQGQGNGLNANFRAPIAGEVLYASNHSIYGNQVIIVSNDGEFAFRVSHLSEITQGLAVGNSIQVGQIIGKIGSTGTGANGYIHAHCVFYKNINRPTRLNSARSGREQLALGNLIGAKPTGQNFTCSLIRNRYSTDADTDNFAADFRFNRGSAAEYLNGVYCPNMPAQNFAVTATNNVYGNPVLKVDLIPVIGFNAPVQYNLWYRVSGSGARYTSASSDWYSQTAEPSSMTFETGGLQAGTVYDYYLVNFCFTNYIQSTSSTGVSTIATTGQSQAYNGSPNYGGTVVVSNTQEVNGTITTTNVVEPGVELVHIASNGVNMQTGFNAKNGSDYSAAIGYYGQSARNGVAVNEQRTFKVMPNPSRGRFIVLMPKVVLTPDNIHQRPVLRVLDPSGRLIKTERLMDTHWEIDISEEPAGMYILQVQDQQQVLTQKVLLEK